MNVKVNFEDFNRKLKSEPVTLRLDENTLEKLDIMCKRLNSSKRDVITFLIQQTFDQLGVVKNG